MTLKREFKEEINADIEVMRYVDVLENIYTLKEQVFHEISLIYEVEFTDSSLYDQNDFDVVDESEKTKATWISLEELSLAETVLYPVGLLATLKKMMDPVNSK